MFSIHKRKQIFNLNLRRYSMVQKVQMGNLILNSYKFHVIIIIIIIL
jgi:hypothetical protein